MSNTELQMTDNLKYRRVLSIVASVLDEDFPELGISEYFASNFDSLVEDVESKMAPSIDLVEVTSSNLAAVGYSHDASVLEVRFSSGVRYRYYEVPASVYEALLLAPSRGSFFAREVKPFYLYEKIP